LKSLKAREGASGVEGVEVPCRAVPYRGKDPGIVWDEGGDENLIRTFIGSGRF